MTPLIVPIHRLQDVMPKVSMYLERAIIDASKGFSEWSPAVIMQAASAGQVHVWVDDLDNPRNVMVGQGKNFRVGPTYYIFLIGGDGDGSGRFNVAEWKEAFRTIKTWANTMNMAHVIGFSRLGWQRDFSHDKIGTLVEVME